VESALQGYGFLCQPYQTESDKGIMTKAINQSYYSINRNSGKSILKEREIFLQKHLFSLAAPKGL
jgi:hypothetical protein